MKKNKKRYFYTGLISLLPLIITVTIANWLFKMSIKFVRATFITSIIKKILFVAYGNSVNPIMFTVLVYTFSILIIIIFIWIVGFATRMVLLDAIHIKFRKFIDKVPVINKIYNTIGQIVTLVSQDGEAVYQKVVAVEYPRKDSYSIGFLTAENNATIKNSIHSEENMVNVFIPTSPNPTSGMLICVSESQVKHLDISVEAAFKLIISGGFITENDNEVKTNEENINAD